ncbi:MAG: putative cytosolic protein, partial [Deltaproteobacteria bacterium]|nr:putative cytosolic protein [Deltaproteobacteria bacterium]
IRMNPEKKKIIARLRRIEGQVRGLQRLIEADTPCVDVLTQVSAVTSAMKKTGGVIISTHMKTCLGESSGNQEKERKEFYNALSRFIDLS